MSESVALARGGVPYVPNHARARFQTASEESRGTLNISGESLYVLTQLGPEKKIERGLQPATTNANRTPTANDFTLPPIKRVINIAKCVRMPQQASCTFFR